MINLLVGTGALPEGPVRWELELDGPEMRAQYKRNGVTIERGRMLNNDERYVYDSDMGNLEGTGIVLVIQGPGKCAVGVESGHIIDCTLQNQLRFYRIPKPKEHTNGEAGSGTNGSGEARGEAGSGVNQHQRLSGGAARGCSAPDGRD